ncbi:MAG: helix-turn-helix domain-containing protein [Deltaproteobacteria bacterium]|nr:helix-turn-helix domain-containing protein [Deltaproteobacteria bacterium]
MTAPTGIKHQLIEHNGQPVAVVVPYGDYLKFIHPELNEPATPHAVVKKMHLDGLSRIQAWREHLGLTQEEVSLRMGIKQSSYQQLEKRTARPRKATLEKAAAAFGIEPSLLAGTGGDYF